MAWIKPSTTNPPPRNLRLGPYYYEGKGSVLEDRSRTFEGFFDDIRDRLKVVQVNYRDPEIAEETIEQILGETVKRFRAIHDDGGRLFFIGNGGSAAIASHMAVDWTKNGNIRSLALNDLATLTCFGNDFGFDRVFEKQLEYQATEHDGVVVISSSGRSLNIVGAAQKAREIGCAMIITLTGMNPNNRLRQLGDVNFYVPAADYGIVECSHLQILHSMIGMG